MEQFLNHHIQSQTPDYAQLFFIREQEKRDQFYEQITEQQKAEFINGEIIVHSPVKIEHTIVGKFLLQVMDIYVRLNDLGFVGYEKMLISLTRNDYEPDICFWNKEKSANFRRGQMRFPAPDFIAEILSPSTAENDRNIKFTDYAAHGVSEYWIIDPAYRIVEQYLIDKARYRLIEKTDSGILTSHAVKDFSVPVLALFDEVENLEALRKMMKHR